MLKWSSLRDARSLRTRLNYDLVVFLAAELAARATQVGCYRSALRPPSRRGQRLAPCRIPAKDTIEYFWIISPKLRGARSRLYRRQILQVNTRWKALAEIYTIHSFAPFFNLKISAKNRQHFFVNEEWISDFFNFFVEFCIFSANLWWIFFRISRQIPEKSDVCRFSTNFAKTN